jgi:flavin reductase (DIM6/NTAB) family NADH-FMN oxidoreductase RutF
MRDLPLSGVYQLLEPGPVVLLTTAHKGRANVMTMSWHMMVEFEPPLVACVVSNADYSFMALRATKECVIAIPALELAPKVVGIGNCSGRDVDKFERFRLTPAPHECGLHVCRPAQAESAGRGVFRSASRNWDCHGNIPTKK